MRTPAGKSWGQASRALPELPMMCRLRRSPKAAWQDFAAQMTCTPPKPKSQQK
jgi:hypothetical protein